MLFGPHRPECQRVGGIEEDQGFAIEAPVTGHLDTSAGSDDPVEVNSHLDAPAYVAGLTE